MLFDALNGYPIDPAQRNVKLKLRPLTRERIPEYEKDFPDGFPLYDFKQHSRVFNLGKSPAYTEFVLASTPHMSASSRRFKIGAVVPTLETEFWRRYYEFMQKGADELGVELIKKSADNIPERLETIVRDLLTQKVDGLIAVPYWGYDKTILSLTKKTETPLIFTDVYSDEVAPGDPEYPNYLAFIGPTDEEAGYLMAKALFAVTPADESGKKHIGCVEGTPGTTVARDRSRGLERALKEHSEVVVSGRVNGDFILSRSQTSFEKLTRVIRPVGEPVLEMLDISVEGRISDITLSLHRGEILGIGGLKGSGGESILEVLDGDYPPTKGEMRYEGKSYRPRRPDQAWEMGIAYLPGSRTTEGLIVDFSVLWNLSMASIPQRGPFIDLSSERALGEKLVEVLRIKAPSVTVSCNSLSGGNLQKVVLGKCMAPNPKVLLLNNPTRGIDVGARMEIYRIIYQLAQNGISVILLSEDLPELIGMSDRIIITRAGKISKTFQRGEHPTEEEIISYMI